jgi:hypothetical protein
LACGSARFRSHRSHRSKPKLTSERRGRVIVTRVESHACRIPCGNLPGRYLRRAAIGLARYRSYTPQARTPLTSRTFSSRLAPVVHEARLTCVCAHGDACSVARDPMRSSASGSQKEARVHADTTTASVRCPRRLARSNNTRWNWPHCERQCSLFRSLDPGWARLFDGAPSCRTPSEPARSR